MGRVLLMIVALGGVLALYNVSARANRAGDQMSRATQYGQEVMETLRGMSISTMTTTPPTFADVTTNGVTYHRAFAVIDSNSNPPSPNPLAGQNNLAVVTVTVTYGEENDESAANLHTLVLQMVRTKVETF